MTDAEAMLEDCVKRKAKLSEWEQGFIQSLSEVEALSVKQYEVLEQIWDRIT